MLQYKIRIAALTAVLLMASVTAFAGNMKDEMTIELEGSDGKTLSLSISADFVSKLAEGLSGSNWDCDGTTEEDTRAMLEHLSKRGEGSKYTLKRDHGEVIKARRKKGQLQLQIEKPGEKETEVSMPWSLAECMLGRDVPALSGEDKLAFSIEQDGAVRIRIE
jgi:hypothetical protein